MDLKAEERALKTRMDKIEKAIKHRLDRAARDQADIEALRAELDDVSDRWLVLVAKNSGQWEPGADDGDDADA